jgi:hypothetical protein
MKGGLPTLVMVFLALALGLGLVVTLAPDAGAQDSVTAPAGLSKWMRYDAPPTQSLEAVTSAKIVSQRRTCCIMIEPGPQPGPDFAPGSASAAFTPAIFDGEAPRWFCWGGLY